MSSDTLHQSENQLRVFEKGTSQHQLYIDMYKNQTYEYVVNKLQHYNQFNNLKMSMKEALSMMDQFVDPSDPDLIETPNSIHAYQTAERIRKAHPEDYKLQLCGLIHDVGKVLYKFNEPGWAIVGDTFVVGCHPPKTMVHYDDYVKYNPDAANPKYNTKLGVYQEGCGLENLVLSFGHDEYLYQVLKHNKNHKLEDKYINIIRFHSFYPWHTYGEYQYFMEEKDYQLLEDINDFNQYDLYSKADVDFVLTKELKKYYEGLLDEYFGGVMEW